MYSPKDCSSPTYRNLKLKQIQSPKELKEKLRKDYKNKVQNCRDMLMNRFRGSAAEVDLRNTLTNIFNDINIECIKNDLVLDTEETKILEEIKEELIQDELNWCVEEYEKVKIDNIDWSMLQEDKNVICPICQKQNFSLSSGILICSNCSIKVKTNRSLKEIKNLILDSIEKHSDVCSNALQFSAICELKDVYHIYFICEICMDMKLIV